MLEFKFLNTVLIVVLGVFQLFLFVKTWISLVPDDEQPSCIKLIILLSFIQIRVQDCKKRLVHYVSFFSGLQDNKDGADTNILTTDFVHLICPKRYRHLWVTEPNCVNQLTLYLFCVHPIELLGGTI
jgi:hypothetical protein